MGVGGHPMQSSAVIGSHQQLKHASKPDRVTVPGKHGDDLAPGTLNSILEQERLKSGRNASRNSHRKGGR